MSDSTKRGVRLTIVGVLLFMTVVVASFIHRIGEPRIMSVAETRANGLFLFDTPRTLDDFSLIDHNAEPFSHSALVGHWTLVFFGFTHCPDICPTTMAELAELKAQLADTEARDARVVMVSVDPARDTPQRLKEHSANVMLINPRGDYHGFFRAPLDIPKMRVTLRSTQYVWEH